jgi:glycosyltransferase involved in cell wall biosynthesis
VAEIVNNWVCDSFEDSYRPPLIGARLRQLLRVVQPHVVHVHNLLNLSFDLPAIARASNIPVVATLHDYTLVCPSGGQRLHQADRHVCAEIDPERCVRCFRDSPFAAQLSAGRAEAAGAPIGLRRLAVGAVRRVPRLAEAAEALARRMDRLPVTRVSIERRLAAARRLFESVDLFVAPSAFIAREFETLGVPPAKLRVSDYGMAPLASVPRPARPSGSSPLRIGYVGTIVWHKGVHVLLDAVRGLPPGSCEVSLFGDPDVFPRYTAALRKQADGLPVRWRGRFDPGQAALAYADVDVLAVPSLWLENSPLVVHEALAAGVPVVAARVGGLPDLIAHTRNGLLYDPADPDGLRDSLRRLTEHRTLLEELSAGARACPRLKTFADDAREWEAAYGQALRARAPEGAPA